MRTMMRRAVRDRLSRPDSDQLPDGVGGTITGGPLERIDLMQVLNRASRCGAVSGAAQSMAGGQARGWDRGIALSDGSRITFASVADTGVLKEEAASVLSEV